MSNCFYEPTFARDPGGLFRLEYLGYATWKLHIKDDSSWTGWSRVMTGGVSHLSTWAGLMKERGLASIPRQLGVLHGGEMLAQIKSIRPQMHLVVRGYVGERDEGRNPHWDRVDVWADGDYDAGGVTIWAEYLRGARCEVEDELLAIDLSSPEEVRRHVEATVDLVETPNWDSLYRRQRVAK